MPEPELTFVALSLNTTERAGFVRDNRRVLPELELFKAVNGFDRAQAVASLASTPLKFHAYTFCNYARFATFGSLANFVTKYRALRMQLTRRLPFMAMLEDDMQLQPGFRWALVPDAHQRIARITRPDPRAVCRRREFVVQLVRSQLLERPPAKRPELLVLGPWGEGYVTSLSAATRVVARLERQGIPLTVDIMLNDGHAGRVERPRASVPWRHRVPPNGGDCLKTATAQGGSRGGG